ncbi:sigma-54 interaction domain-containing protein [Clostridium psychrophilum]|uniref:sigma-54 interaction domain-containing protein n=1 Tax=Clostridium psychrophilum TaxID=132926 RepID=UPI001C0DF9B7|nr:sigma 54-interacting transcriptional regulator [Clostridium psychrophilum]MBU3180199.1 sigma 54-interacting transcriptional regulator [Clostridium psychrophilum]
MIKVGDELKVKKIMKYINDMMVIIRKSDINAQYKKALEQKYDLVNMNYSDFIDNYLDFREISNNLHDGIYIASGEGNTIFVNDSYVNSTGISRNEIIGRNVKDIVSEGKLYKGAVTMEVIKNRKEINSIGKILKNNKEVLVTGNPIFDENGKIKLVVINNRDTSDLKELENKIVKLKANREKSIEEIKFLRHKQVSLKNTVFTDEKMQSIMRLVQTVALTDTTVLITGESGTGKEIIADEIYNYSKRKDKPFIKVNCSAIPAELVESELFGYEGGAFTDAKKVGKMGLFELAKNGTILLDEIGDMPLNMQSKLLRVLQEKEFMHVGGKKVIKIDFRVIASTNRDLKKEVNEKRFREDLFYRLNIVPVNIPPLREHKGDIENLTNEFLNTNNKKHNKNVNLTTGSLKMLQNYKWPGNVRELENFIERVVVISLKDIVEENDIALLLGIEKNDLNLGTLHNNLNIKQAVQELEKNIITKAIKRYGSTRKAAEHIGINQSTIVKKCKKLGINLSKI